MQVANKHTKRCCWALVIRETQNKTMTNLPTKWLRWKKLMIPVAGKNPKQQTLFYIMNGNLNWHNYFGKSVWQHLLKLNIYIPHNPAIHSYAFIQWYIYMYLCQKIHRMFLRGTIHNKNLGKFKCTSTREWTNCYIFR